METHVHLPIWSELANSEKERKIEDGKWERRLSTVINRHRSSVFDGEEYTGSHAHNLTAGRDGARSTTETATACFRNELVAFLTFKALARMPI